MYEVQVRLCQARLRGSKLGWRYARPEKTKPTGTKLQEHTSAGVAYQIAALHPMSALLKDICHMPYAFHTANIFPIAGRAPEMRWHRNHCELERSVSMPLHAFMSGCVRFMRAAGLAGSSETQTVRALR